MTAPRLLALLVSFALASCAGGAAGGGGSRRDGDQPPPGIMTARGPVGLFFMTYPSPTSGSLETAVWYFAPDGTMVADLEEVSAAALSRPGGRRGRFRVGSGYMVAVWPDGKETRSRYQPDASGFLWGGAVFTPVEAAARDEATGTWEGGQSARSGGGIAATSRTLELHRDGTYRESGVTSTPAGAGAGEAAAGAMGEGGTWRLDGYTLTLRPRSGAARSGIAFPYRDDVSERPARLYFAGTVYRRQ